MAGEFTEADDELLAELGVEVEAKSRSAHTPREERIIAGFEEIQRFVEEHGRAPQHGEDREIFERLYAVRLDRIREQEDCRTLVEALDHQGLLTGAADAHVNPEDLDDDALLTELGVETDGSELTVLKHVRSNADKRAAKEVANRQRCEDFERFRPLFEQVQKEMDAGIRETRPFGRKAEIEVGRFFIVGGQKAYVAAKGDEFTQEYGDRDARLRVIFDNGTESDLLMRSLQRALNDDDAGRRITDPTAGPLFAGEAGEGDEASGTIYVLRSRSELPIVAENRGILHKIGVTKGDVTRRIANARLDPTFLMADVEVVATYDLFNINRTRLENVIHRIFAPARADVEIKDRFGNPVIPREWFFVPLFAIDEAVERIRDGSISRYVYDPEAASLVDRG